MRWTLSSVVVAILVALVVLMSPWAAALATPGLDEPLGRERDREGERETHGPGPQAPDALPGPAFRLPPTSGPAEASTNAQLAESLGLDAQTAKACLQAPACDARLSWFSWTESAPIDELSGVLTKDVESWNGPRLAEPQEILGYNELAEDAARDAWRSWYLAELVAASAAESDPRPETPGPGPAPQGSAQGEDNETGATGGDLLAEPRGLKHLWRLDGHGSPRENLPAGGAGESLLVTDSGVLYFLATDEPPDWMMMPSRRVMNAGVSDVGSGNEHVVVGTEPTFFDEEAASLRVVEAATGNVVFRGMTGAQQMLAWTLTDVDGDGTDDIFGLDIQGRAVALQLDGNVIYRNDLELLVPEVEDPVGGVYFALLNEQLEGQLFGDLDGDGTMDLVVPTQYFVHSLLVLPREIVVSAYSGADDAQPLWHHPFSTTDLDTVNYVRIIDTGDFDGDGTEDVLIEEYRLDFRYTLYFPTQSWWTHVLAGEDGTYLSRHPEWVCVTACLRLIEFTPLGFIDRDGDGTVEIIGLQWNTVFLDDVIEEYEWVLREMAPVPGAPALETDRFEMPVHPLEDTWVVWREGIYPAADGSGEEYWLFVGAVNDAGNVTGNESAQWSELHKLTASGVDSIQTPEPMWLIDVDPVAGSHYGWVAGSDQWVRLDEGLAPIGEGLRLVLSVEPLMVQLRDGDSPDVLIATSSGYRWVSGADGRFLEDIDRPSGLSIDGVYGTGSGTRILEYDPATNEYVLFDPIQVREEWRLSGEERYIADLQDATGDGQLEAFVTGIDFWGLPDNNYELLKMPDEEVLWEQRTSSFVDVYLVDILPVRRGAEILIVDTFGSATQLVLHVPGEDEPVWSERQDGEFVEAGKGAILLQETFTAEAMALHVVRARDGESAYWAEVEHPEEGQRHEAWARLADISGDGSMELVYSYRDQGAGHKQFVHVVDWAKNRTVGEFELTPPTVREIGDRSVVVPHRFTRVVEGIEGQRSNVLAFQEGSKPVLRHAESGEILAVGPNDGAFAFAEDLTGDRTTELGLLQGPRLRWFTYAPGEVGLEDEMDPETVTRDINTGRGDDNRTVTLDTGDKKGSPGLPIVAALGVFAGAAAWSRRRR